MNENYDGRINLDGLWLRKNQLLQLAMCVGNYNLAEHYLCALLADAVVKGRREAIMEVNKVREHYGVMAFPLAENDLVGDEDLNGKTRLSAAEEKTINLFLSKTQEERIDVLRRCMNRLLTDYDLFNGARNWLAIFLVIRDRLMSGDLNQTEFIALAGQIAPDNFPEKWLMSKNTMKNFSREIIKEDRAREYYRMKRTPQRLLCNTFWGIIQETILTEI